MIVTIRLPAISGRFATFSVAASAAPGGNAAGNSLGPRQPARVGETFPRSSPGRSRRSRFVSSTSGTKPAPMPWIGCGAGAAAGQHRARRRLDRDHAQPGLAAASAPARQPVSVPPVPMPETIASTSPAVSYQISSAVVRTWIAGLAGLANWFGHHRARRLRPAVPWPARSRRSCPSRAASAPARRRDRPASCAARSTRFPASSGSACSRARRT